MTLLLVMIVCLIAGVPAGMLWWAHYTRKEAEAHARLEAAYKAAWSAATQLATEYRRGVSTVTRRPVDRREQAHLDGNPTFAALPTSHGYDSAPAEPRHSESHFSGGGGDFGGGGASASYDSCGSSDSGGGCDGGGGGD